MSQWISLLVATMLLVTSVPIAIAQQWHTMTFQADAPGVDENPLRGFVPYSSTRQTGETFPHSMEWFYLPLAAVVKGPDIYDWSAVEQQLTAISRRGHQAIFRFFLDYPTRPTGIPEYLLRAGLKTYRYDDSENAKGATTSVSPDYADPRLIECLVRFIHAFGRRYDGDVRIAYLTAGLYGFWGEWHVHNHPLSGEPAGWSMEQKDKDALLRAYAESFTRTQVLVRSPNVTKDRTLLLHFGFHDDSFLQDTIGEQSWQYWPMMGQAGTTGRSGQSGRVSRTGLSSTFHFTSRGERLWFGVGGDMRAAIYARVSTKDQSCEMQLHDLRAYCAARGFTIIREYIDIGQSGAKDSRPQLNELMADARKRKLDAIIVWRFDRFARSTKHLLLALEEFRSLGIQFVSYQENIDTEQPAGAGAFHDCVGCGPA